MSAIPKKQNHSPICPEYNSNYRSFLYFIVLFIVLLQYAMPPPKIYNIHTFWQIFCHEL